MAGLCQCLSRRTSKVEESGPSVAVLRVTAIPRTDRVPLMRSSQGVEIPLGSTCPIPSCPPCPPEKSPGLTQSYVLQERGSGWTVVCRLTKEKGVREASLQQKQVENLDVESLEVEELELLNFGDEQRVRREVASGGNQVKLGGVKEVKDFYLQDCEEADQWCKIVPYLLNIEAETEELGQESKIRKEDKEGVSVEVMVEAKPSSSQEERLKIVHFRHSLSWAPFLTIIGVFVVVMAAFVLVTSMVMRKLNRVSASTKLMRSQSHSSRMLRKEDDEVCPQKLEFVKEVTNNQAEHLKGTELLLRKLDSGHSREVTEL